MWGITFIHLVIFKLENLMQLSLWLIQVAEVTSGEIKKQTNY